MSPTRPYGPLRFIQMNQKIKNANTFKRIPINILSTSPLTRTLTIALFYIYLCIKKREKKREKKRKKKSKKSRIHVFTRAYKAGEYTLYGCPTIFPVMLIAY
jgi:peroxiredoxin family protein